MSDEIFYVYPQHGHDKNGKPAFDKTNVSLPNFCLQMGNM